MVKFTNDWIFFIMEVLKFKFYNEEFLRVRSTPYPTIHVLTASARNENKTAQLEVSRVVVG